MRSAEFDVNALAERLIPVLADAQSCRAYMYWRKTFGHIGNGQSNLYVYGEYETINDATLMLSLVALRKIDEFLSDETKKRSTDLRYSDFGICKEEVLIDRESIISRETQNKINKHITHLTDFGQPSIEAWENLDRVLEAAEPTLKRLEIAIRRLLI